MKYLSLLIMIVLSIYYLSCESRNDGRERLNNLLFPDLDIPIPIDCGKLILANGKNPDDIIMDSYTVNQAKFNADTLNINVSYSGGCKEHEFCLVAWNYFLESNPVQAYLVLSHNSNSDYCEAGVTSKLSIDMSPLKKEYITQYGNTNNSIIVKILIGADKRLILTYKF
jgi:hypothetical protein